MTPTATERTSYHHGSLREALALAAVELARAGGPSAIVLREIARTVGVSPNAAYRHYATLSELVGVVCRRTRDLMMQSMRAELDRLVPLPDPREDAEQRLLAVGRGYVRFALAEPGLFRTAFDNSSEGAAPLGPDLPATRKPTPWGLLRQALADLAAVGALADPDQVQSAVFAWSAVHGLAMLLLNRQLAIPDAELEHLLAAQLRFIGRALVTAPDAGPPEPPVPASLG